LPTIKTKLTIGELKSNFRIEMVDLSNNKFSN